MSGKYPNPLKMYLAGVWDHLKGLQINVALESVELPTPQNSFVYKGEGLDSKVLDS